ncbi:hypothetical protein QAD02_006322 [Eretmocerus hayati]|uniref:Uncharacterized protein n=2 Tax=Eretmocerus hayati TaxID=131215 RepID=A0ACC2N0K3_9HYME|nr:hypothetical protein QAD02_006322 [Eretmocerus hayati]
MLVMTTGWPITLSWVLCMTESRSKHIWADFPEDQLEDLFQLEDYFHLEDNMPIEAEETVPLKGDYFEIVEFHDNSTLSAALADIKCYSETFQKHPIHKYVTPLPNLALENYRSFLDKLWTSPHVRWFSLKKHELVSADKNIPPAVVYEQVIEKKAPPGLDAKDIFWNSPSHYDGPTTTDAVSQQIDRHLAELAAGKWVPYLVNITAAAFGLGPNGKPLFTKTELDEFVLHLDIKRNPNNAKRPGINIPTFNIGTEGSFSSTHTEDGFCSSGNLLKGGAAKALYGLRPQHYPLFNAKLVEFLTKCPTTSGEILNCSDPLQHKDWIVPTFQLKLWGISFEIILLLPGMFIYLGELVIHFAMNFGRNWCVATNIGTPFWNRIYYFFVGCKCDHNGNRPVAGNNNCADLRAKLLYCPVKHCRVMCLTEEAMKQHEADHFALILPPRCVHCQRRFANDQAMVKHSKECYVGNLSDPCPKCSGRFIRSCFEAHKLVCSSPLICVCKKPARPSEPTAERISFPQALRVSTDSTDVLALPDVAGASPANVRAVRYYKGAQTSTSSSRNPSFADDLGPLSFLALEAHETPATRVEQLPDSADSQDFALDPVMPHLQATFSGLDVHIDCPEHPIDNPTCDLCPRCFADLTISDHDPTCAACLICVCGAADFYTFEEFRSHRFVCLYAKEYLNTLC